MDRSCVVTGAGSGIGAAIAARLDADGWSVVGVDLTEPDRPESIPVIVGDVVDRATSERAADVAEQNGRLTGWVNCAGIAINESAHQLSEDATRRQVEVNLLGTAWGCSVAVQRMLAAQTAGAIVNISSVQANRSMPQTFAYAATKAAGAAMARQLAVEYAGAGIRANAVLPGAIATPLNDAKFAAQPDPEGACRREAWLSPIGRLGTPAEVAACVAWLLSADAAFVSGQEFGVDGGAAAWLTSSAENPDLR